MSEMDWLNQPERRGLRGYFSEFEGTSPEEVSALLTEVDPLRAGQMTGSMLGIQPDDTCVLRFLLKTRHFCLSQRMSDLQSWTVLLIARETHGYACHPRWPLSKPAALTLAKQMLLRHCVDRSPFSCRVLRKEHLAGILGFLRSELIAHLSAFQLIRGVDAPLCGFAELSERVSQMGRDQVSEAEEHRRAEKRAQREALFRRKLGERVSELKLQMQQDLAEQRVRFESQIQAALQRGLVEQPAQQ